MPSIQYSSRTYTPYSNRHEERERRVSRPTDRPPRGSGSGSPRVGRRRRGGERGWGRGTGTTVDDSRRREWRRDGDQGGARKEHVRRTTHDRVVHVFVGPGDVHPRRDRVQGGGATGGIRWEYGPSVFLMCLVRASDGGWVMGDVWVVVSRRLERGDVGREREDRGKDGFGSGRGREIGEAARDWTNDSRGCIVCERERD